MSGSGGGGGGGAANPWLVDEPEETRGLSFGDIKQQQQSIIQGERGQLGAALGNSGTTLGGGAASKPTWPDSVCS